MKVRLIFSFLAVTALTGCVLPDQFNAQMTISREEIEVKYFGNLVYPVATAQVLQAGKELSESEKNHFINELKREVVRFAPEDASGTVRYTGRGRIQSDFTARRETPGIGEQVSFLELISFRRVHSETGWDLEISTEDLREAEEFLQLRQLGISVKGRYCISTELPVVEHNAHRFKGLKNTYCWDYDGIRGDQIEIKISFDTRPPKESPSSLWIAGDKICPQDPKDAWVSTNGGAGGHRFDETEDSTLTFRELTNGWAFSYHPLIGDVEAHPDFWELCSK